MCNIVLALAAVALLSSSRAANVNRHMKMLAEMDNHIQPNAAPAREPAKPFIALRKPPALAVRAAGAALELTCEALAAPAPSIHWFRNDAPIYEHDLESNELVDSNPGSLARITSTLLVPRAAGAARYTCLVASGARTSRASTLVLSSADNKREMTERWKLVPLAPRVLVSYKILLDVIGSKVALPCRARGHPRPLVLWKDNHNNTVNSNNPRMKVLRSGELVISGLRWSDMGEYSCHASNVFGDARANTFLYPARPNDTDG